MKPLEKAFCQFYKNYKSINVTICQFCFQNLSYRYTNISKNNFYIRFVTALNVIAND